MPIVDCATWAGRTWFVLWAALATASAVDAAQGVYESVPLKDHDESLIKSSSDFEKVVERRGYLYADADVDRLVQRIGRRLAPEPTDPYLRYRFHVFRNPHPNAFALPDGQVYVHTGMLAILENEAQLATLLAHEINHSAGHHSILHYRSARKKIIAGTVASSLGGVFLGDYAVFGDLLASYAVVTAILGYGRDLEEEADRLAMGRIVEIGYDVRESARLFELLARDPEGERVRIATKWSSHPDLLVRASYLREMAEEIGETVDLAVLATGVEAYEALRRRVALDTVQDYILADYPRSALALAGRLIVERPEDPAAHLAAGDAYRVLGARPAALEIEELTQKENRKRARERARMTREEREVERRASPEGRALLVDNLGRAEEAYARALALDPTLAEAHRGRGMALKDLGRYREAGRELALYLEGRPHAPDRPVVLGHVKQIVETLKAEEERNHEHTDDP